VVCRSQMEKPLTELVVGYQEVFPSVICNVSLQLKWSISIHRSTKSTDSQPAYRLHCHL